MVFVFQMYLYFLLDFNAPFILEGSILKTRKAFDFEMQQSVKVEINALAFGSNIKAEFEVCIYMFVEDYVLFYAPLKILSLIFIYHHFQ
jgi:hypothetical protein